MENDMVIINAQYQEHPERGVISVQATIDGQEMSVPIDPTNRHYAEILKQVAAGTLTVADAD